MKGVTQLIQKTKYKLLFMQNKTLVQIGPPMWYNYVCTVIWTVNPINIMSKTQWYVEDFIKLSSFCCVPVLWSRN